ncbi:MAG: galactokinase family protein [Verrucomicrobiota bacterium]
MLTLHQLEERIADDGSYGAQLGPDPSVIAAKRQLASGVLESFRASFPSPDSRRVAACFVPGRVEVLGKHTDYAGGHSLLAAVDRGFFSISARNGTNRIRLVENDRRFPPCEFELTAGLQPAVGHWSNYPMTMVRRLVSNFGTVLEQAKAGVDVAFGCDLPVAGGMSGSSALMIMTYFALALPNRLPEDSVFRQNITCPTDLAMYLACAENGQTFRALPGDAGVGTFGGSEDHTQILCGRKGKLSLFQFCPTEQKGEMPLPPDLAMLVAYSGVKAEKTGPAMHQYNSVSRRARLAVEAYNTRFGTQHRLLRELMDECGPKLAACRIDEALAASPEAGAVRNRFGQFMQEDREIIPAAVKALVASDYPAFGCWIDRSHAVSRDLLGNIIPEIDHLQASARRLGALAASGFGAGFGGSAYAIVPRGLLAVFPHLWREAYLQKFPGLAQACAFVGVSVSNSAGELFG